MPRWFYRLRLFSAPWNLFWSAPLLPCSGASATSVIWRRSGSLRSCRSLFIKGVPARKLLGDDCPLVADFVMQCVQFLFLLSRPLGDHHGVEVLLIPNWWQDYRSRHCLALRAMLNSSVRTLAIMLHFLMFCFSYRSLMTSSSFSENGLLSRINNIKWGACPNQLMATTAAWAQCAHPGMIVS